jgi:hypothetical protein
MHWRMPETSRFPPPRRPRGPRALVPRLTCGGTDSSRVPGTGKQYLLATESGGRAKNNCHHRLGSVYNPNRNIHWW